MRRAEPHADHQLLGYRDFLLADAPVALGDASHQRESGFEESLLRRLQRRPEQALEPVRCIGTVTDQHAEKGPDRAQQQPADQQTDDFAEPGRSLHACSVRDGNRSWNGGAPRRCAEPWDVVAKLACCAV